MLIFRIIILNYICLQNDSEVIIKSYFKHIRVQVSGIPFNEADLLASLLWDENNTAERKNEA